MRVRSLVPTYACPAYVSIGVILSVVGEMTDSTNRAGAFGMIFSLWAVGGSLG